MMQTGVQFQTLMSAKQRFFMMTAICLGAFLSHFTAGVVNVSLPSFTQLFQTELGVAQWITTGYLLVIASLLPVMGKLGDRYGHRMLHNYGFLLFTISSVLVACSTTIATLLVLRVVQAVGAAMFQATNIALITLLLPKEVRGRALGIMSTAVALGGMTGPIAGGFIASVLSWEWLFLAHVPVAVVATVLAFRYIPVHLPKKQAKSIDVFGSGLFTIAASSLIFAISGGNEWGWLSARQIMLYGLAVVVLWLLIWRGRHQAEPFLPVAVFRLPAVSTGLLISFASFVLANLVLVAMPFYLLDYAKMSSLSAGYLLTAYPLLLALTGPLGGWAADRYQAQAVVLAGLGSMGAGLAALGVWLGHMSTVELIAAIALVGAGMGLIASPNNSYIMKHVPLEHAGAVGGMIALTRNAGLVTGAALGLGMMNGQTAGAQPDLEAYKTVFIMGGWLSLCCLCIWGYATRSNDRKKRANG